MKKDWQRKNQGRKKRRRKPYIRYERALAAGEFKNANTENSIALVDKLVEDYWGIMPLEELTTEVSSELTERRKEWDSRFKRHIEFLGIWLITSRIKHPQTNGKIEKTATTGIETILKAWMTSLLENNVRFHESLDTKHHLQTPDFWSR